MVVILKELGVQLAIIDFLDYGFQMARTSTKEV